MQRHTSSSYNNNPPFWKNLWATKAPPKILNFLCKCSREAIPTKTKLFRRKCSPSSICPLSGFEPETLSHLLFNCDHARTAWFASPFGHLSSFTNQSTFSTWWSNATSVLKQNNQENPITCAAYLCWQIWMSRNNFIFNGSTPVPKITSQLAVTRSSRFLSSRTMIMPEQNSQGNHSAAVWSPPVPSTIKYNVDASCCSSSNTATLGGIARDCHGSIKEGFCLKRACSSVVAAEAFAVRAAVQQAQSKGFIFYYNRF